jgi:hypothetical protein
MDRDRFDALARVFATRRSRRSTLAAILGASLFDYGQPVLAKPGKSRGKGIKECTEVCEDLPVPENSEREFCCPSGGCSCGGKCNCRGECFLYWENVSSPRIELPERVFCCTSPICGPEGNEVCREGCETCDDPCPSGITGSYRRR